MDRARRAGRRPLRGAGLAAQRQAGRLGARDPGRGHRGLVRRLAGPAVHAKLNLGNDSLGLLWIPRNTNPVYYQWYGDKRWFTEYHWHGLALIAGNAYVLAGLALFGLLGALALLLPQPDEGA